MKLTSIKLNQYFGIFLSVAFAILIRTLAGFNVIEINSLTFLLITPAIIGLIPFFIKGHPIRKSFTKAWLFPLISATLFFLIVLMTRVEDLACLLIMGIPYLFIYMLISIVFYVWLKDEEEPINKNVLPIFMLPLILGMIEKQLPKQVSEQVIQNEIIINQPKEIIWKNLLSVPDLTDAHSKGLLNYLGIPKPIKSMYNPTSQVRLGYFENGIVLHETVTEQVENHKMTFKINIGLSKIAASPTLEHILKKKNLEFEDISYELVELQNGRTKVKLSTKVKIHSNLSFYAKFWSNLIIEDFETSLLRALKKKLERMKVLPLPPPKGDNPR